VTRLGNATFAGWLRSAESDYWRLPHAGDERSNDPAGVWLLGSWLPPASGPGSNLTVAQLGRWIDEGRMARLLPAWPHLRKAGAQSMYNIRAARFHLAVALYQAENPKQPLPTMQDLVPRYLPEALVDPLTGRAL
jgi:hypothetical protein